MRRSRRAADRPDAGLETADAFAGQRGIRGKAVLRVNADDR
ncbi:hypothetical protein [Nocardia sp. NPDC005998]